MALRQDVFDVVAAHPLKQAAYFQPAPKSRVGAGLVTVLAHIAVIAALLAGVRTAPVKHPPAIIMLQIDPDRQKPADLSAPAAPDFVKPDLVTAPVPLVTVAPPPAAMAATPPPPAPAVATAPGNAPVPSNAVPTWQGLLLARLEQAKRYPEAARMRRQQGVVMLRFTMDRTGRVLTAKIDKSSGYDALDQETLDLIARAQPLPAPPAEMSANPIELIVPIEFTLKSRR